MRIAVRGGGGGAVREQVLRIATLLVKVLADGLRSSRLLLAHGFVVVT